MSPERELFVICKNCSSEVSPYVTECPYCGTRLRKRAPDLKKQRKAEERSERKAEKKRARIKSAYEGSGGSAGAWLDSPAGRPVATGTLIAISVVASVLAASGPASITRWMLEHLVFTGSIDAEPWKLVTSPFLQYSFGYGFVCLLVFAIFGAGIERRCGKLAVIGVWVVCGALGVLAEAMIAPVPVTFGAYACASGAVLAWTMFVSSNEDLRDADTLGLGAVAFVLCMLPIATNSARVSTLVGGIVGGLICGAVLTRKGARG